MMSALPRRTAAVTALAVTAFSGAALAEAGAASAAARAHTSLSIRTAKHVINPGGGDAITGDLHAKKGGVFGRKVSLLAKVDGTTTWAKAATHYTGDHGTVGFEVTPSVATHYRLVFAGNANEHATYSGVVGVRIAATTSLTVAVAAKSIAPGASDAVSGVLSLNGTAIVGDTVKLRSQTGSHKSAVIGTSVTAADGSVSFPVTPPATTHYVLVFAGTATNGAARSAEATIHVLQPSSLSIRARANAKAGTEIITGSLHGAGHGLFHRTVKLQYRASGTSTWTSSPGKRTNKSGAVAFSVPAPTADEDYQLVFAGGPLFDPSLSGVVTVSVPSVS